MITRLKLKGLYMYAGGFYTYSIFALIFWETRRSDFGVSMGHHVATAILIILSYIFRFVYNVLVIIIILVLIRFIPTLIQMKKFEQGNHVYCLYRSLS